MKTAKKRKRGVARVVGYGCLTSVLLFLTIFVIVPILIGSGHPGIDHEIHEFPGVQSDEEISIAVDSDDDGAIYLAWSTPSEGTNYAASIDGAESWSKSVRVGDSASVIDLFAKGDTLVVFSISIGPDLWFTSRRNHRLESYTSVNGGRSWSEPRQVVDWIDPDDLDLLVGGDNLYLAFHRDGVIHFMRSEDIGVTWSGPFEIGRLTGEPVVRTFALTRSDSTFFIFWLQRVTKDSVGFQKVPILLESSDAGRSWRKPEDLSDVFLGNYKNTMYGYGGGAVSLDSGLFVFYGTNNYALLGSFRSIRGRRWSPARRVWLGRSSYGRIESVSHSSHVFIGIVDARYRASDPIGYVWLPPFYSMFPWANNDLELLTVGSDGGRHDEVITPPASRVSHGYGARTKRLLIVGDELFIFWTGRRKVGRTLDAFGYKEQIFWAKFDLHSLD